MTNPRPETESRGASATDRLRKTTGVPRVLCVDDDLAVLRATARVLATRFDVTTAIGGPAALEVVRHAASPFAVIVSDLRMPELSGIGLFQCVRQHAPQTSRVLLTGNADVASAVDAVNAGEIFRFLTKPCAPQALIEAVAAACTQHAHAVGETPRPHVNRKPAHAGESPVAASSMRDPAKCHSALDGHLDGYVSVLRSVFAVVRPMASDCASRIEWRVTQVLRDVHLSIAEHITAAAALSQLGSIGVPLDVAERIYGGWALSADDRACADGIRGRSAELVSTSADLALVRGILSPESLPAVELSNANTARVADECTLGARILDIACLLEDAARRGGEGAVLKHLMQLERNPGKHGGVLVEAFRAALRAPTYEGVRTMRLRDAVPSMVLAADVVGPNGLLVARRGQRIGEMLATRSSHSWSSAILEQTVEVIEEPVGDATRAGLT